MGSKSHVVLAGSKRAKDASASRIGDVDPNEVIELTIGLAGPRLPGPDERVGETLTPAELAERFSARKEDADKITGALRKYGIDVVDVSLEARSMRVRGTAKAIESAFKPRLALMRSARQGDYRGREGSIMIPKELRGLVTGVFGLDTRRMAKRRSVPAAQHAAALAPLTPADLEARYDFPPGDGAGQIIAIAEFGGGYFAEDTAAYCNKFQRPTPNVQAVAVDAPAFTLQQILELPKQRRNDELLSSMEVMMDVQVIAGLCPRASIAVYFSTFDQRGWIDLLSRVIAERPAVLSISWGLAEDDPGWSSNAIAAISDRLNALRLLGVTTCVSSGDDGSGDQIDDGGAHVDFPSCSPFVLSVGGTMLRRSGAAVEEVTWWDAPGRRTGNGGGSTGGGVSTLFDRPKWQNVKVASLNKGSIDGRVIPDVSALAGEPLYDLVFVGRPSPNGGTSASAPLWAALIARTYSRLPAAKQRRFLAPLLYRKGPNGEPVGKVASRDISVGNNASHPEPGKGYKAKAGFDAVTGWGVPDGVKLLNALAGL
jgi:kumamolisin